MRRSWRRSSNCCRSAAVAPETSPGQPHHRLSARSWQERSPVASPPLLGTMRTPPAVIRALTGSRFETINSRCDAAALWFPVVTWNLPSAEPSSAVAQPRNGPSSGVCRLNHPRDHPSRPHAARMEPSGRGGTIGMFSRGPRARASAARRRRLLPCRQEAGGFGARPTCRVDARSGGAELDDHSLPNRIEDDLRGVVQIEFLHEIGPVGLDR